MNIALVGTGTIAEKNHLPILTSISGVNIVALCDNNEKRLSRVAKKFNVCKTFSDIDELLEDMQVDIVDITTPGYTHYEIAMKALNSDMNVLVEKPATLKTSEAEQLQIESSKRNLKLGVCQAYRYSEPMIRFQKIREQGGIGNIDRVITIQHGSTIYGLPQWFWNEDLSGGILFELGIHAIDLQCYLLGNWKDVLDVNINYNQNLDFITSILATIKFEDAIGIVDLKWLASSSFMHQYVSGSVADSIIKFYPDGFILQHGDFSPLSEFTGELKRIWNFGFSSFRKKYYKKSEMPHRIMLEDFINSVNSDTQPLVTMSNIIPTIRLAEEIWCRAKTIRNSEKNR
jgi:predicted dehydrogenase